MALLHAWGQWSLVGLMRKAPGVRSYAADEVNHPWMRDTADHSPKGHIQAVNRAEFSGGWLAWILCADRPDPFKSHSARKLWTVQSEMPSA
jgi:hypothetical protein